MKTLSTIGRTGVVTLTAASALLAACASTVPAGDDDLALQKQPQSLAKLPDDTLRDRSLAVRTGSTPSFYADTPGRRTFGMAGVVAMMREGNRLVEDYGLKDPATQLSEDLSASLAARNGMRTSPPETADLLLNVKTINWDFRPYRNDPNDLYVSYAARVTLVDRRAGTVLASGKCRSQRDGQGDSATLDQLLEDGAKRLQNELREAAAECGYRLKSQTLNAFLEPVAPVAEQVGGPEPRPRVR